MAGKAKKKPAGTGKAAPKQAKTKVVAKGKTAKGKATTAKGKATPARKKPKAALAKHKPSAKAKAPAKAIAKSSGAKSKAVVNSAAAKPKAAARSVGAKSKATAAPKASKPAAGGGALVQSEILAMARQVYGDLSDTELLALDPNDVDDMDPSTFYEMVGEKYGVKPDPDSQSFGGFGGPIRSLIEFVGSRWDGKTRGDAPMPPQAWLDEFVHPATERAPAQEEPQDEPLLD